jgi:outer membrane protein assembly factor BamB
MTVAKGLPLEWSETQNVVWKVEVPGRGWSSPAIKDGRIWLTTATSEPGTGARPRQLRVLTYDVATGKPGLNLEVFSVPEADAIHAKNSYASPTPILEGDRVYVHFGNVTACLKASGEVVWKKQHGYKWIHGPGGSPALWGDLLIFSVDGGDQQYVVALEKSTGEVRWKTERPKPAGMAFSTPLVIETKGGPQLVSTGAHKGVSYDPKTGKQLWMVDYGAGFSNVPRPVFAHGLVYLCTGFYQPELLAIRPDGQGDVTGSHIQWKIGRSVPLTPSPVVVGDEIYFISDNGILTCADAKTGRVNYQQRLGGNYSASPLAGDGRIYWQSEEGETIVIAPGKEFKVLARNHVEGQTMASLGVWGKSFILRSGSKLYRIEQK